MTNSDKLQRVMEIKVDDAQRQLQDNRDKIRIIQPKNNTVNKKNQVADNRRSTAT